MSADCAAPWGGEGGGGLSDAQLLERFVRDREEAAFEVLVWRHAPLVLGVCRRALRDEQEAETATEELRLLDEEIGRLPAAYRAAVVLCYLEGQTQAALDDLRGKKR